MTSLYTLPTVTFVVLPPFRTVIQGSPFWSSIVGLYISFIGMVPQSLRRRSPGQVKWQEFAGLGCIFRVSSTSEYFVPRSMTFPGKSAGVILDDSTSKTAISCVNCCSELPAPTTILGENL